MTDSLCDFTLGECDDPAEVFRDHILKARVEHTCEECQAVIAVGARYERISMRYNEHWHTYRTCLLCREISSEFHDGGRVVGVLWDGMIENWEEGAHLQACLNRLSTAKAKHHLRDKWMAWKGLRKPY